jgi:C-terminal processing protease CtpA/Prc
MKLVKTAKSISNDTPSLTNMKSFKKDTNELVMLLSKLNIETILQAHDKISTDYYSKSDELLMTNSQMNDESSLLLSKAEYYCVENLKLVNIDKPEAPLGATIRSDDGRIVIGRIVKGGAADLSGLLHENDEILEVNSVAVRGKTINDISEMLVS